ncbi:uncharacterized protein LOC113234855 [Hyposmocoma kahamanoa]|uniref:uncharacterized protein LOC113234855 n=1 Tax=Hyposmocoma kahamanoa TaxID=1477025 RepID=UPI000E6D72A0|nr:uncharacterized protein LOC113234855 [Hyposmocoma kahamanoa]
MLSSLELFKVICLLWIVICNAVKSEDKNCVEEDHRSKRQLNGLPLVYPYGGLYKLILGIGVPIKSEPYINLAFAANFQYQYTQFQNISQLSQYYFIKEVSREEREAESRSRKNERLTFYKAMIGLLEINGMNGHDCVLRAICEAAQYPVEEEGLFGEIIHILLTPDYGRSLFEEDLYEENAMAEYNDAATAGRQMFHCPSIYEGCPEGQGFFELITKLVDEAY